MTWEAVAAGLSALATLFAAIATWRGPIAAAALAEKLRSNASKVEEQRRLKFHVFATLMQERSSFASNESVRALNLIDVIYKDSRKVREAWAEFFETFDTAKNIPAHTQVERQRRMLQAMAEDLGLADGLRSDDLSRSYFPNVLAQENLVRTLEREESIRRLQEKGSLPTANTAAQSIFPPPPAR